MSEATIVVKNTAKKYIKGSADHTIRKRLLLAALRKEGRIKTGGSGYDCNWNVRARQHEVRQSGDASQNIFIELDANEQLTVDIRGYKATDVMSFEKKQMNKEPLAIVDLYATKMPELMKDLRDQFGSELYVDGYATGNGKRICGIESFMGDDGNTIAADIVAKPSDTYAGKATAPGTLGGTWSSVRAVKPNATLATDWPYGNGSSEYDYIAPKLCNYSSTSWQSGDTSWRSNGPEVLRRAKTWCQTLSGGTTPMLHMLSASLYDEFLDYMEAKYRAITPHKYAEDLGFMDGINYSGSSVQFEFNVPSDVGYGLNIEELSMFTLTDDLFYSEGPHWDMKTQSYLFLVGFLGNMRANPKAFAKYKAYA